MANPRFSVSDGNKTFYFDSLLEESHNSDITITKNAVELGAIISDHFYVEPKKLKAVVIVSDTNFLDLNDPDYARVGNYENDPTRSIACFRELQSLQVNGSFLTITTSLRLYENFLLEKIDTVRDGDFYFGMKVELTFTEVRIAITESVDYKPLPVNGNTVNELGKEFQKNRIQPVPPRVGH